MMCSFKWQKQNNLQLDLEEAFEEEALTVWAYRPLLHFHTNTTTRLKIIGLFTQIRTSPCHKEQTSRTNTHDIPQGLWGY